jgi:hypothetical protein
MDPLTIGIIGVVLFIVWPRLSKMIKQVPIESYIEELQKTKQDPVQQVVEPNLDLFRPPVEPSYSSRDTHSSHDSCLECLHGFAQCLPKDKQAQIVQEYASDLFMKEYGYDEGSNES